MSFGLHIGSRWRGAGDVQRYPRIRVMKDLLCRAMLSASMLTGGAICQAQSNVYSINGIAWDTFLPAPHRPDEIEIWSYTYGSGAEASRVEWYVSTNTLAKQPRWDGLSAEVPLSARKACALALLRVRERLPRIQLWTVESVLLRKPYLSGRDAFPDVWWYEITFAPHASEDRSRADYQAGYLATTQLVLLDGTVVPQTALKRK
jgi:hypothetical protein